MGIKGGDGVQQTSPRARCFDHQLAAAGCQRLLLQPGASMLLFAACCCCIGAAGCRQIRLHRAATLASRQHAAARWRHDGGSAATPSRSHEFPVKLDVPP